MNIFIRQIRQRDRQRTDYIYTRKRSTHNNKITEMHTNIEHSPERLTRHCEWHQIYDKTQIWIKYHRHSYYTKKYKNINVNDAPSQSSGVIFHMRSQSQYYICHPTQVNTPQPDRPVLDLPTQGTEGWVDLGDQLHTEMVYRSLTVTHLHVSTNSAVHGRESNSRPVDHRSDALITAPPRRAVVAAILFRFHRSDALLSPNRQRESTREYLLNYAYVSFLITDDKW